jgi:hypothetical protein
VSRTLIAEQINFHSPAGPQGGHEGKGGGPGGWGLCGVGLGGGKGLREENCIRTRD